MDSGFLQPGETLEDAYDTLAPLLPEEVIGIMDQLLCYEMAWHTGYPLSQTLLSSVYIDRLLWPEPKVLEEAQFYRGQVPDDKRPGVLLEVLRAYCIAQIKTLSLPRLRGETIMRKRTFARTRITACCLCRFRWMSSSGSWMLLLSGWRSMTE
jgi:hypothetical protein